MNRTKTSKSSIEAFERLTDAQKERVTKEFDQEFIADKARDLTPTERRQWQRAKRKMGRPVKGKGHKVISVSVEKGLLARSDALARRQKTSRAALIARGLQAVLEEASA